MVNNMNLRIMTINIGNPSLQRAQRQIEWIQESNADVIILTEVKVSAGCLLIEDSFDFLSTLLDDSSITKLHIFFPKSKTGDLGVMVLSRYPILESCSCFEDNHCFYSRCADVVIDCQGEKIGILGLYVPSRNATQEKILRKSQFIKEIVQYIRTKKSSIALPYIVCGDFNILERHHVPHYGNFKSWEYDFYDFFQDVGFIDAFRLKHPTNNEYSWVGRTDNGYRYDHCFLSTELAKYIDICKYIHETRKIPITDHSALFISLKK